MHLNISTQVRQDFRSVIQGFNQDLFLQLNPPFPPVQLVRFDGCKKGDIVSLELNFLLFKQRWESLIVEDDLTEKEFYFIDEGIKLPFFLKYWRHRHRILKRGRYAEIIDDITFRSPFWVTDLLLYPVIWLQFLYRKPIYKNYFS